MWWTRSFFRLAKNDSASALSEQMPVRPNECRSPSSASLSEYSADVCWVPRSELRRIRFNSDYAEVSIKPRKQRWRLVRLYVSARFLGLTIRVHRRL
jgi:hypothetical protein